MLRALAVLALVLAPALLAAQTTATVDLTWTDCSPKTAASPPECGSGPDNPVQEDGFRMERRPEPGSTCSTEGTGWVTVGDLGQGVTAYSEQIALGQGYCYRVRAFAASGVSGPSNMVFAKASVGPPAAPGGLTGGVTTTTTTTTTLQAAPSAQP